MNATNPEASPMLIVDCPLCERPAPFDTHQRSARVRGVRRASRDGDDDAQVALPIAA